MRIHMRKDPRMVTHAQRKRSLSLKMCLAKSQHMKVNQRQCPTYTTFCPRALHVSPKLVQRAAYNDCMQTMCDHGASLCVDIVKK